MLVIRPSAKLAAKMRVVPEPIGAWTSTAPLCEWYASAFHISRKEYVLFVSENTRVSVVTKAAPIYTLSERFLSALFNLTNAMGFQGSIHELIGPETGFSRYLKPFNRSIIGGINRFIGDLKAVHEYHGIDLDDTEWMSWHITSGLTTINGKYEFPVEQFHKLVYLHGLKLLPIEKPYRYQQPPAPSLQMPPQNPMGLTPEAEVFWNQLSGSFRMRVLNNVFCRKCGETGIKVNHGTVSENTPKILTLNGSCTRCGLPVARVIES